MGLLARRQDWDRKLQELFLNDHEMEYVSEHCSIESSLVNQLYFSFGGEYVWQLSPAFCRVLSESTKSQSDQRSLEIAQLVT